MSEVTRYDITEDVTTGVVDITPVPNSMEGRYVSYEDYAVLQQNLELATLTHDYQQDQINYWNDISRQQAEENVALQQKLDEVLAENVSLKSILEAARSVADNSHGISGWHLNGDVAEWDEILPEINEVETPATDAILNEVRAEGAMAARNHIRKTLTAFHYEHHGVVAECADMAEMVADELRTGSKEGGEE